MECNECPHIGYMSDPWDDTMIKVTCCKLGTGVYLPNIDNVPEYDFDIKQFTFDLGTGNSYCPYHNRW